MLRSVESERLLVDLSCSGFIIKHHSVATLSVLAYKYIIFCLVFFFSVDLKRKI